MIFISACTFTLHPTPPYYKFLIFPSPPPFSYLTFSSCLIVCFPPLSQQLHTFTAPGKKSHINCIPRLDYLSVPFILRTPRCAQNILISGFFVHFSYTLLTLASSVVLPISVGSIIPLTSLFICSTPPTLAISSPSAALLLPAYLPSTPAPAAPSLRISQS